MTTPRDLPREYARALRKCTPKQRAWLRELERNGYRTWKAGKKLELGEGTVSRWRRMAHVQAVLALQAEMVDLADTTSFLRLRSELSAIANFDVRRLFDENGKMKHPKDWDDDTAAAIQGLDIEERHTRAEDGTKLTELLSTTKPRAYNKLSAIETLIQLKNLGAPKRLEVTGKDGAPLIPDVQPNELEIARRLAFLLSRGEAATS